VFARPDQVKEEALKIYDIITKFYTAFGMPLRLRLSVDDPEHPEKYLGGVEVWTKAVEMLKDMLQELGKAFELGVGEAAFYGPKIDFIATDAIGREWQLATIQLDFNLPERFELEFHDADGHIKRPVMIHRAILGSVERFMGVLIEHYAGAFPFWLAPAQVRIATVSEVFIPFAETILAELVEANVRAELDDSNEKVGKKIRDAAAMKIPWTIVIGQKEVDGGDFQVKVFGEVDPLMIPATDLVSKAVELGRFPV
jgi:threonyl-tRNA synthetase